MFNPSRPFPRRLALALACTWSVTHAVAADPSASTSLPVSEPLAVAEPQIPEAALAPVAASSTPATPSQNVTINLINRLVQRGVLSKEDAADLIQQAEADAVAARAQAAASTVPDDAVRVTYIPEVVKDEIRDDLRAEVMKQAYEEKWAAPRAFPTWVSTIRLFGDLRVRYQGDFFPSGNDNTGGLPNFNSINTGSPFDVTGNNYPPELNADADRNRFRLRARVGAEADLGENFTAGFRIGTGDSNSPVSSNQTLGGVNSFTANQGGNFSKYSLWLDRAFLKYDADLFCDLRTTASVGRFDNPFYSTSIIWADDLGFDGLALKLKYSGWERVKPFFAAGAFPVFNTDFNFASNQPSKYSSEDKWLEGVQLGTDVKITQDWSARAAVAFYAFQGVDGKLSSPFTPLSTSDIGDTDARRPAFAQKGNTYMALRDIVATSANSYNTLYQYQYYGLATPFRDLALTGQIDYGGFDPCHIALKGEYIKNVAFDGNDVNKIAVNNFGPDKSDGTFGAFEGGDTAWNVQLVMGRVALEKRWDWNLTAGYRYVESDAVIDGFCDSDFGGGGTNLKGFTVGGGLGLSSRVWVALRWMSADSVAGPTYKQDIIQFDINAKF